MILLRNNRWYRDDAFEVPNRLLRRWIRMLPQEAKSSKNRSYSPDLDVYSEVVMALSPEQIRIGLSSSEQDKGIWTSIGGHLQRQRELIQFYASLPSAQKEIVKAEGLPVHLLTPEQGQALGKLAFEERIFKNPEEMLRGAIKIERHQGEITSFRLVYWEP